jgi:hypothetical protein
MINGLKFQFTSDELRAGLHDRAARHEAEASKKEADLPELKSIVEKLHQGAPPATLLGSNAVYLNALSSQNPVGALEEEIRIGRRRARNLRLMADHVAQDTYELTTHELREIELIR